jgi:hypothetical protein
MANSKAGTALITFNPHLEQLVPVSTCVVNDQVRVRLARGMV